jgi:hypothetical protein
VHQLVSLCWWALECFFNKTFRPTLSLTQPLCQWVLEFFVRDKTAVEWSLPLTMKLLPLYALLVWTGTLYSTIFTFNSFVKFPTLTVQIPGIAKQYSAYSLCLCVFSDISFVVEFRNGKETCELQVVDRMLIVLCI